MGRKTPDYQRGWIDKLIDGMTFNVDQVRRQHTRTHTHTRCAVQLIITIRPRGADNVPPPPPLRLRLDAVSARATNADYEVVDLQV